MRIFSPHGKTSFGSLLLFAMLFDVGGVKQFSRIRPRNLPSGTPASMFFVHLSSASPLESLDGVSLRLHRRLAKAAGMKRVNNCQQKLPLSLHQTEMLEGSEIFVCSILHTFSTPVNSRNCAKTGVSNCRFHSYSAGGAPLKQ